MAYLLSLVRSRCIVRVLLFCAAALAIPSWCYAQFEFPNSVPTPNIPIPSLPDIPLPQIPGVPLGHKTNKWDVRHELEDGWLVAYGKEVGYEEYYLFGEAVKASVATRNPGPAMAYMQILIEESVRTMAANAGQELGNRLRAIPPEELIAAMSDAIRNGRINNVRLHGIDVQLGMATYNRSESGIPLPNTFQPFLRMRVQAGPAGGPGAGPGPAGGFRSGAVQVTNDYGPGGTVVIRMYHPQGGGRVFQTWTLAGQQSGALLMPNGQPAIVGSDWGIQVVFGNGVTSPIRVLGTLAQHDGRNFAVPATRIFGQ